ncbi:anthranilate phosphoribosyltransferase [bacterium]|nr:anthranilate phosphoribosyltransferase [bacterium]
MILDALRLVVERRDLDSTTAETVMTEIMEGQAAPTQVAAFITALRMKGETTDEIAAFVKVMRAKVQPVVSKVHPVVLDTCGTGGDGSGTFNISTAVAFVAAGAGAPVAKHGNRSVSSRCGSADVLRQLGVNVEAAPETVARCLDEAGICFIFAPLFHPAMKHAIGPRREIGIRTVFNVLGPLTNPAGAVCQLLGVYDSELTVRLAEVLAKLGSRKAYVVHGHGGLDELSLSGPSRVACLENGRVRQFSLEPSGLGLALCPPEAIRGGEAGENARIVLEVLEGQAGPRREVVLLNAAAAISAFNEGMDLRDGLELAARSIDSGAARDKLALLVRLSQTEQESPK